MIRIFSAIVLILLLLTSCAELFVTSTTSPNVFSLDEFPDIGSFTGKQDAGRFYDEITYDFVASDEYGQIIPYVGSYRVFGTNNEAWNATQGYTSYGFCTPDGKIVMDASDRNNYINYQETDDGFGYYCVTRDIEQKDDAPDEFEVGELLLIPLDGSWCVSFPGNAWVSSAGSGYIFVSVYPDYDIADVKTYVYNYDGVLVNTLDGIEASGQYSSGLIPVYKYKDSGPEYYFYTLDGEMVLGPFSSASFFNENGIAPVIDFDGNAKLIDVNGDVVKHIEGYDHIMYEFSPDEKRQLFVARSRDNRSDNLTIFDSNADIIGTIDGTTYASLRYPDNVDLVYYYTTEYTTSMYTQKMVYRRLSDGSDVISEEFGVSPNSYNGHGNCYIHLDEEKNVGVFFDVEGKTIAVIDDICEVMSVSSDNKYIAYHSGKYSYEYDENTGTSTLTDTRKFNIFNTDKNEIVYSMDKSASAYFPTSANGTDERFLPIYVYEESNNPFGDDANITIYDMVNQKVLVEESKNVTFYMISGKTYINVCTDNSAALYDDKMNVIRKTYFE